ncbi:VC0807 family protein [Deinococcus sp.]|uniref:VC0807 family protein n=1 Tax=Deinococcus sp. TaxID=47478 RepID=UPI003B5A2474
MTVPSPAKSPRKKAGIPKTVWDLLFTLIIPIAILSPNILGSGISVAEQVFGGGVGGNVRAYLLAALIPVAYVLIDLLINRTVSGIALLGGAVALVRGALAFWYVDGGPLFAFKDSVPALLFGVLALGSLLTKTPIFRIVLDASTLTESPENRAATQKALHDGQVVRAVRAATVSYGVVELASAVVNYFVNLQLVVGKFGSDSFNAEVAQANAVMRVPGLVLSLIGVGVGIWLIQMAVKKRYGPEADIFSPDKLARLQEAEG